MTRIKRPRAGRPRKDPKDHQVNKYTKMAVYKTTHKRIKKNAEIRNVSMLDYLEDEIR